MALSARQGAVRCASDEWRSRSQVGAQVVSAAPSSLSQVLVRVNGRTICIDAQFDRNGDPAPAERYLTLALQKAYSSLICRKSSHTGSTSSCSATLSSSLTRRTPGRSLSESTCSTSALTPRSSPWQLWSSDSGFMEPGDPVRPGAWVEARLRHGLRGGKGGFGNTLRASARRGGTGTTDFSACRDLSGRRLRHVNNEIRLRHWREEQADRARERDGNVNEDDQTHRVAPKTTSGIKNWFLPVPSWADSVPKGKKNADTGLKVAGRGRRLCQDWARARVFSNLKPAADAPVWIGCPRGRSCPFSHREDELTPAKRADIVSEKRKSDRAAVDDKMREFVTQMQETESTMQSSILEGLRRSKQASVQLKAKAKANAQSMEDDVNQDLEDTSTNDTDRIQCLCGDIDVGEFGEVLGRTKFSTAIVPAVAVTDESWYFEVTLLADPAGSLQIGCATELFEALEHSEDGVGDLPFSWALDPIRGKFFNQGAELDAMFNNELLKDADVVKSGCTIGCHLDVCKRQIYFSINGSRVSIAGKSVYEPLFLTSRFMRRSSSLSSSSSISSTQTASSGIGADSHFFYPAISMDEGSFVRINLGERPFQCVPLDRRVHGLCGDSNLRLLCSDSSFASDKGAIAADSMAFSKVHIQPEMPGDDYKPVDLDAVESVKELEALGLGALKQELDSRNLKCGGTLEERAARLFSVKGLAPEDIDLSLRPKRKKRRIV